jgi:hypothetical protein
VFALSAVATAFVGLKIADTVSQFSQLWTKLSDGEGMLANLADAVKGKLGTAFDAFLQNQAPNFKKSLDDMKQKSVDAAAAETTVGTEAETSATKVTIATAASVATKGIGLASVGALIPVLGLALAMAGIAKTMHDTGITHDLPTAPTGMRYDGNHQLVEDTVANNAKIMASYKAMQISASDSVTLMNGTIAHSMDETKVKSYTDVSSFTNDAMNMFQSMGAYGTQQMQTLDQNTIGYWNDVAGYISSHPINAAINIDMGQGSTYSKVSGGIQKNFYAGGVTNAPPGWAIVGEKGPELMHMHGGEDILPHGQLPYSSSSSGGSGGGGHSGPVTIIVQLDSKQIGHATAPHIVQLMRVKAGLRS